ncbi:MAG: phosphate ABC transporter permease subunit PstC [Hyphomicrobiaceae bacterium]
MSVWLILLALAVAAALAAVIGVTRARRAVDGEVSKLHSRLGYYGAYLAILTVLPAVLVMGAWLALENAAVTRLVTNVLPDKVKTLAAPERKLMLGRIRSVAEGLPRLSAEDLHIIRSARFGVRTPDDARKVLESRNVVIGAAPEPFVIAAAYDQMVYKQSSRQLMTALVALLALACFVYGFLSIKPRLRARNFVERVILGGLIAASTVAILTTFGIVLSVLFETLHFFQLVPPDNFFFGQVWDPRFASADNNRGDGQFGLFPLLWGTLFISFVALSVAVPIGLYAAIYMSEYASQKFRAFAKPVLEILAGIPTIVYGFFALITFGPFMRDLGAAIGLNISATSVLVAGIVMGVMIIPFVSSLSDDIISAVPQSLREGSLGLGATQSETIKRVVLPAALPGIVGAVLLAASRAIGETMIVVLAAGIAANLTINPFEPVTTITVKIVSQLTGDLEFTSPQTLVAFALGLTLFVITLGLNIYALYIVRKYKEQYE